MKHLLKHTLIALVLLSASAALRAQGPSRNSAEVAAGGGYSYLDTGRVGETGKKNHGVFNASASYNITTHFSAGFEYAISSLASASSNGVSANVHLSNYGALFHIGLLNTAHVQPYLAITGGAMRLTGNLSVSGTTTTDSHSGGYLGAGLGSNFYLGHGLGVRPEVRYTRQQLSSTVDNTDIFAGGGRNQINLTGELFYTFGGRR